MQVTLQTPEGQVTIGPIAELDPNATPRFFMGDFDAEGFLSQFLLSNNAMDQLRLLVDDFEPGDQSNLSDNDVVQRLAQHIGFGAMGVVEGGGGAGLGPLAGAGNNQQAGANDGDADGDGVPDLIQAPPEAPKKKILIDIVVQLQYWNPVTKKVTNFPKGAKVMQVNNSSVIESKTTDDKGIAAFSEREYTSEKPYIMVDLLMNEYIDLDKNELVAPATVRPGDKRRLLRLPNMWDSTKQKKFSDNRGGRFSTGKLTSLSKGQQGTKGAPWKLQIDIAWEKVWAAFVFYNHTKKKDEGICYGGLLEAFSDAAMSTRVGGCTVIDKVKGLCYLAIWHKTDLAKLGLKLRCPSTSYIDMAKDAGSREMAVVASAAYDALTGKRKREHYPLPAEWRSKRQYAFIGKKSKPFEKQIKKKTSQGKPITFHLDDFVLVDGGGTPIPWAGAAERFSVFTNLMRIRKPDANEPYLTKYKRKSNHFAAQYYFYEKGKDSDNMTRAVAFNRDFYDLTNKRTTSGDLIGCRAATVNDHPRADHKELLCSGAGNYRIHYFHDCAERGGQPLAHLVVHWTCLFQKHPTAARATTVSNSTLRKYKKRGLSAAKVRLEGRHPMSPGRSAAKHKDYRLRPRAAGANPKRTIKVCFFFEARKAAPVHCTVNVQNDGQRDRMGITGATFSKSKWKASGSSGTDKADNLSFKWFTLAHELGHATGLDDEYLEPIDDDSGNTAWDWPILPNDDQYYPGMPFSIESGIALMESNKALRMRHFWGYCRYVNEDAAVKALLGNQRYQLEYRTRTGATLRYHLKDAYKDIYKPFKKDEPYTRAGTQGVMHMYLYKTGEDEMQRFNIKAGTKDWDSILVVNLRVHFNFPANHAGTAYTTWAKKLDIMHEFQDEVNTWTGENGSTLFGLESATGDFKKVAVYIRPYYSHSGTVQGSPNFTMEVRPHSATGTAAQNAQDVYKEGFTGTTIKVTQRVNWGTVLRYMLGAAPIKVTGAGAAKVITKLTTLKKADLNFLGTWVRTKTAAGAFTVKKY